MQAHSVEWLWAQRIPRAAAGHAQERHAPYSPTPDSPLRSFRSLAGWVENFTLPWVLPRVSSHAYLRPGFWLSERSRRMLLGRYHRAIELMDEKLADFYGAASAGGLLDDTLLVATSDHGEAFGEHGLYFHDASVYDTHLHVPLEGLLPCFEQNLAAAVVGMRKVIVRREGLAHYDLAHDPEETAPAGGTVADFETNCRRDGWPAAAIATALAHLRRWETTAAAA